jgi:SAM-dependent methyltransferase
MNARLLTKVRSKLRFRALMRQKILGHSTQQVFARMYERNSWANAESASGNGSDLKQTTAVRTALGRLIADLNIRTLLDAPCGDFYWMKEVDRHGSRYLGVDIVPQMIAVNERNHGDSTTSFAVLDITKDEIPQVDMIVCRDCLVHLPLEAAVKAVQAFFRSGSKYLLSTTYPGLVKKNRPLYITGNWRPLDLERAPFFLPPPLRIINEGCTEIEDYAEKSLGLWTVDRATGMAAR